MIVNDLNTSAHFKLAKIMETLDANYGIHLDFASADFDTLMSVYENCAATRSQIIESASHNSYHSDSRYTEVSLIQEAIHIFLSEVAPKRLNRRLKNKPAFGANNE